MSIVEICVKLCDVITLLLVMHKHWDT